jgi:uroporphyrinogen-III synthase
VTCSPDGILVTRPQPGADETAARLAAMGFAAVLAPMLTIAPRTLTTKLRPQAVLITSGNALAALPEALRGTRLLAVGDATAARARAAGFTMVHSAARDAAALAELAVRVCAPSGPPLLLASGEGQGHALAAMLRERGFRVVRRGAYAASPVATLPPAARSALVARTLRAALFFSPLTARVFVNVLLRSQPAATVAGIDALAISRATEVVLRPLPWRHIHVASSPTQDELLTLLS